MHRSLHLTLALLVSVSAGTFAETEPIHKPTISVEQQLRSHTHYCDARESQTSEKNLKLPDVADVLCGAFRTFAGKDTKVCFTRNTKGGNWDSFIIDLNGNQDLTDDPVLAMPGRSMEKLTIEHEGRTYTFNASSYQNRSYARVRLSPLEGSSGSLTVNGKDIAWIACDCNLSGKLDAGDTALLDMNDDGICGDRAKDAALTIGPDSALFSDNAWFCITPAAGNNELAAAPYSGKLVHLSIDPSKIRKAGDAPHDLLLYTADNRVHNLPGVTPAAGVKVPPGTLSYISGNIKAESRAISYYVRNVTVEEDTVLTLELPESQLTVRQSGSKISVSQKVASPGGFMYRLARGKKGPLVEIFAEANPGEPVTTGNMAYG